MAICWEKEKVMRWAFLSVKYSLLYYATIGVENKIK